MTKFILLAILIALIGFVAAASNHPKCGLKPNSQKISNGMNAERGEFPWQGSIQYYSQYVGWRHVCGAVIINENFVLTTANCVNGSISSELSKFRFLGGEYDRSVPECTEVTVMLNASVSHPSYDTYYLRGNLALLKLARPLDFEKDESHLLPICIPEFEEPGWRDGTNVTITGWGFKNGDQPSPAILQKVEMIITPLSKCSCHYNKEQEFCSSNSAKAIGKGDYGGPAASFNLPKNRWYSYGITSYSCDSSNPKINSVRVAYFSHWIWQTVKMLS